MIFLKIELRIDEKLLNIIMWMILIRIMTNMQSLSHVSILIKFKLQTLIVYILFIKKLYENRNLYRLFNHKHILK